VQDLLPFTGVSCSIEHGMSAKNINSIIEIISSVAIT